MITNTVAITLFQADLKREILASFLSIFLSTQESGAQMTETIEIAMFVVLLCAAYAVLTTVTVGIFLYHLFKDEGK